MRLFLANQAIPSVRLHPAIFASMSVTSSARHVKSKGSTKIWRCFIVNRGPLRHGASVPAAKLSVGTTALAKAHGEMLELLSDRILRGETDDDGRRQ